MNVIHTMQDRMIHRFQHRVESQLMEGMKSRMHWIQFVVIANLIRMKLSNLSLPPTREKISSQFILDLFSFCDIASFMKPSDLKSARVFDSSDYNFAFIARSGVIRQVPHLLQIRPRAWNLPTGSPPPFLADSNETN
jgi:hypothetical protein